MTKDKALFAYFNTFCEAQDLDCYVDTSVPNAAALPYLTYQNRDGAMGDRQVSITVNIWCRTTSEAVPNELARDLRKYIETNGRINCDEGAILAYPGEPWCVAQNDQNDANVKLRYINVSLDFLTE